MVEWGAKQIARTRELRGAPGLQPALKSASGEKRKPRKTLGGGPDLGEIPEKSENTKIPCN